ncbi:MAG: hypothetical protein NC818_03840 [Candidatus Omnitrophica bacterium]|nr:hypothetical protein [Candidatus Omnitrophota bacterium]
MKKLLMVTILLAGLANLSSLTLIRITDAYFPPLGGKLGQIPLLGNDPPELPLMVPTSSQDTTHLPEPSVSENERIFYWKRTYLTIGGYGVENIGFYTEILPIFYEIIYSQENSERCISLLPVLSRVLPLSMSLMIDTVNEVVALVHILKVVAENTANDKEACEVFNEAWRNIDLHDIDMLGSMDRYISSKFRTESSPSIPPYIETALVWILKGAFAEEYRRDMDAEDCYQYAIAWLKRGLGLDIGNIGSEEEQQKLEEYFSNDTNLDLMGKIYGIMLATAYKNLARCYFSVCSKNKETLEKSLQIAKSAKVILEASKGKIFFTNSAVYFNIAQIYNNLWTLAETEEERQYYLENATDYYLRSLESLRFKLDEYVDLFWYHFCRNDLLVSAYFTLGEKFKERILMAIANSMRLEKNGRYMEINSEVFSVLIKNPKIFKDLLDSPYINNDLLVMRSSYSGVGFASSDNWLQLLKALFKSDVFPTEEVAIEWASNNPYIQFLVGRYKKIFSDTSYFVKALRSF